MAFIDNSPKIIADIASLRGGTNTVESIVVNQETILDAMRSAQSAALLTMTGAEQTLYEYTPTATSVFLGGNIDLSLEAADDVFDIKIYKKIKSGGAYALCSSVTYTGVQAVPLVEIAGDRYNRYGIKVTATQSTATTSYKTIDHEWFDASPGV